MQIRYLLLILLAACVYLLLAYYVVAEFPSALVPDGALAVDLSSEARTELILAERASVRSAAVALLTGSALGVAGLVAFLSYVRSRSEHGHMIRKHQDELFARALELSGSDRVETCLGAIRMLAYLAVSRRDLRDTALAVGFYLVRKSCTIDKETRSGQPGSYRPGLRARAPTASAALEIIGSLPLDATQVSESAVLQRSLDNCDLGGAHVKDARYEIIDFSSSVFSDSRLVDVALEKCVLTHTDWSGAQLRRVAFRSCVLTGSNVREVAERGVDVEFDECTG